MAASFSDGTVRVWSAATGARLAVLSGGDELDDDPIAFGPGGNLLVNVDDSNRITEWKLR
jgi:WD40 repeat protein